MEQCVHEMAHAKSGGSLKETVIQSIPLINIGKPRVEKIDTDIEGSKRATVLQGLRNYYGQNKVANVVTFGTEGSKQAIQTAARGLEIDNDIALYISSLSLIEYNICQRCSSISFVKKLADTPIFFNLDNKEA